MVAGRATQLRCRLRAVAVSAAAVEHYTISSEQRDIAVQGAISQAARSGVLEPCDSYCYRLFLDGHLKLQC